MPENMLSVIICTYNRAWLVGRCLDSLLAQSTHLPLYEVIVVDGSPNAETRLLVAEYSRKSSAIRYVLEERPGHSNARNRGYHEANGEYLIYLDDDAVLPEDYLKNVVQVIRDDSPDIMGGPVYPYYTSPKPWWFRDEFEIRKYESQSGFSRQCGMSGGNFIIRKSVLEQLGLFDPGYGMSQGKLGMLDEAKTLTLYRTLTPAEQQKVYYSLECYIKHHTPKEKMQLAYMVKRRYITGLNAFQMYLEIDGKPDHHRGIKLLWLIPVASAKFVRDIFRKGLFNVDYVRYFMNILMTVLWSFGYLLAQLQYLVNNKMLRRSRS
jgi:glycosyltransferase involved in cell wall biosynthesis